VLRLSLHPAGLAPHIVNLAELRAAAAGDSSDLVRVAATAQTSWANRFHRL
jgi:hypothetical protein